MQKKNCLTSLLVALFALLPMTAVAGERVKLAEWNLEASDDIAATWFAQGGAPRWLPTSVLATKPTIS